MSQEGFLIWVLGAFVAGGALYFVDRASSRWTCILLLLAALAGWIVFIAVKPKPTGQAANNFGDFWVLQPLICIVAALFAYGVASVFFALGRVLMEKK